MAKSQPFISFIIPCLNEQDYIYPCVTSIQEEMNHYKYPYEIIVVDNNSTDMTNHNAQAAGADIIVPEERPGVVWARQKGFEVSSGRILAFIDADAILPWGWVETALHSLAGYTYFDNIVAVSGPLHFYDAPQLNKYSDYFYKFAQLFHHMYPTMQGGNYAVKREALEKIGGFDTSYEFYGEDTRTAIQLSAIGKIVLNPHLIINTSGRRLVQQGVFNTVFHYVLNYFSTNLFNRAITKHHENFR